MILLEFTDSHKVDSLTHYIEATWPESRNMKTSNIEDILAKFEKRWGAAFRDWLKTKDQYASEIDSLIVGRNNIAHLNEANTTNITLQSMRRRLQITFEVVDFLEDLVL